MENVTPYWERKTSLFWFAAGVFIAVKAYKLGLGNLSDPGPGFIFFGSGILLCIFSTMVFVGTFHSKEKIDKRSLWVGLNWGNPILISIGLILYASLFNWLGFLITCFLLTLSLLKVIGHMRWLGSILNACFISLGAYFIFVVLLKCSLPKGILPF